MALREQRDERLEARVDAALAKALGERRIVGGVLRVARDGALVARRVVGFADREARTPMRESTPFRVASLTKPIVTVTALGLVERGVLSLDDQVARWLPSFTPKLEGEVVPITVRHLLTHTSGLGYAFLEPPGGPYHTANVSDGLDQPGLSLEENLRRLASLPLRFRPGSNFFYSLSTDVLGAIVERASDAPLPDAVARAVTDPLGMRASGFTPSDPELLATPYADGKEEPVRMVDGIYVPYAGAGATFAPSRALDPRSYPSGGAGMASTAEDFHVLLEALRTRHPFAAARSIDAMFTDQIASIAPPILGDGWGYGYGAAVLRDPVRANVPMHPGTMRWGGAFGHSWWVDPVARISVVLLT
ncbi:MAG TPA: serine hydrolase domain-containing protein, partial [Polyangiaceae bacterium]|nr:serine hydrolase domain-containing protein [Polyangiaceae bacterium]